LEELANQDLENDSYEESSEGEIEAGPTGKSNEGDDEMGPDEQTQNSPNLQAPASAAPAPLSHWQDLMGLEGGHNNDNSYTETPRVIGKPPSDEKEPTEGLVDEPRTQSQKTPDKPVEWEKESEKPETLSHAGSFDSLVNSPMRDQDDNEDKEIDETQEPSPTHSNASEGTVAHRTIPEGIRANAFAVNKGGEWRPPFPDSGREASSSMASSQPPQDTEDTQLPQDPSAPLAPIFITMGDADDARFAPFVESDPPKPEESRADVMARDQIRRCEALRNRPLTVGEKEVIRSYYRDMNQRRAPEEVSEPTAVDSRPPSAAEAETPVNPDFAWGASGSGNSSLDCAPSYSPVPGPSVPQTTNSTGIEYLSDETAQLLEKIDSLEARLKQASDQRASDQERVDLAREEAAEVINMIKALEVRLEKAEEQHTSDQYTFDQQLLDKVCADINLIGREKQDLEEKVEALEKELKTTKIDLEDVQRRTTIVEQTAEAGSGDPKSRATESRQASARRIRRTWFSVTAVVLAMIALVWVVTEAMLHSNRLSDGFGPFINGGYSGLGSVVIFGTWTKFSVFNAMVVYLGVYLVLSVIGL
jgi:hypothetical protein